MRRDITIGETYRDGRDNFKRYKTQFVVRVECDVNKNATELRDEIYAALQQCIDLGTLRCSDVEVLCDLANVD